MSKTQLDTVRHDYIRYANCWEDPDALLKVLDLKPGNRILSIGSAGDNSFSMLTKNPSMVVAVDINHVQLELIHLKKAAFQTLEYNSFLQFLGFADGNRAQLYQKVRTALPEESQKFWDARQTEIVNRIIYQGKFERYFELFRTKLLPLIHSKKNIEKLFEFKTAEAQKSFYQNTWNNWRWRLLFKVFFSKFVMGKFGRDPKFLNEVKVPVAEFIFNQAETHLESIECQANYFLQFILTGRFKTHLPHYARPENFNSIKENLDKLVIFHGLAEDAFKEHSDFDRFNLSNIFEYMDTELFKIVGDSFIKNSASKARIAYWNLMVPRNLADVFTELKDEFMLSASIKKSDKGFFYSKLVVNELK